MYICSCTGTSMNENVYIYQIILMTHMYTYMGMLSVEKFDQPYQVINNTGTVHINTTLRNWSNLHEMSVLNVSKDLLTEAFHGNLNSFIYGGCHYETCKYHSDIFPFSIIGFGIYVFSVEDCPSHSL